MKNILRETNPAEVWLEQRFATSLQMANGHLIVVRFDLPSTGLTGYRFTTDDVVTRFGDHILADKEADYGEYLNVASTIAGVLNERMDAVALSVIDQCRMSLSLLDALDAGAYDDARLICHGLLDSLDEFDEQANRVWGRWMLAIASYLRYC